MRGFGLEGFGVWSIAIAALGLSGVLDLGLGVALIHHLAGAGSDQSPVSPQVVAHAGLVSFVALGLLGGLAVHLASPVLVSQVDYKTVSSILFLATLRAASFGVVAVFLRNWAVAVFSGFERYGMATVILIVPAVIGIGGASVGASYGWGVDMAMMWNVGVAFAASLVSAGCAIRAIGVGREWLFLPQVRAVRRLVAFGGAAAVGGLSVRVYNLVDRIVVGIVLGASSAGAYTVAVGVANKINSIAQNTSQVLMPRISLLTTEGREDEVRGLFLIAQRLLSSVSMALGLLAAQFAHPLLSLWLGAEMASIAAAPLMILAVIYSFLGSAVPAMHVLNGMGRPWVYSSLMLGGASASLTLLVTIGSKGLLWAAGANIGATLLLGMPIYAAYILRVSTRAMTRWYGLPIVVGGIGYLGIALDLAALPLGAVVVLGILSLDAYRRGRRLRSSVVMPPNGASRRNRDIQ